MPPPAAAIPTDSGEKPSAQPRNPQPAGDAQANESPADTTANAEQTAARENNQDGGGNPQGDTNRAIVKPATVAPPELSSHTGGQQTAAPGADAPALVSAPPADTLGNPIAFHAATDSASETVGAPATAAPPAAPAPMTETKDPPAVVHAAQEIAVSVASSDDQKVEVRLVERAGEVHVSVRTTDETLAHTMREDLGSLTGKLAQNGFNTESYSPARAESSSSSNQRGASENQDSNGGSQQGSRHGGSSPQQQSQQESRNRRPAWLEAMENSLAQDQKNRSTTWLLNR
jgi:hypothetical protein